MYLYTQVMTISENNTTLIYKYTNVHLPICIQIPFAYKTSEFILLEYLNV
jgi:hypothetical protein